MSLEAFIEGWLEDVEPAELAYPDLLAEELVAYLQDRYVFARKVE